MSWQSDKTWSDRFVPTVRSIVGMYLLQVATDHEDRKEATDILTLDGRAKRIAVRIRKPGFDNFKNEFTLRHTRESRTKTEFSKIIDGFGDWMFYGHAANDTSAMLARWMLIDLAAFRAHLIRYRLQGPSSLKPKFKDNNDYETSFVAFDVRDFVGYPPLLIGCSHPEEMRPRVEKTGMVNA